MKSDTFTEGLEAQSRGLSWLIEMEAVSDPNFSNALILNIAKISSEIKDIQVVCDTINKRMLVWIELSTWKKWFRKDRRKEQLEEAILIMLSSVLPSYTFRVVFDKEILEKALALSRGANV